MDKDSGMDSGELELLAVLRRLLGALGARDGKVVAYADPPTLVDDLAPSVGLAIATDEPGHASAELVAALEVVIARSVRSDHPRFFNQNYAGADPIAILGDALGAALNNSTATYETAPVFTLMERAVLAAMAERIGWPARELDAAEPAGMFCAGGSMANLCALQLARHALDPDIVERGAVGGPRFAVFTSSHAHYSIDKAARVLGLGARQVRTVATDATGAMDPAALEAAIAVSIADGLAPMAVNLTAGTTVTGAFDPIEPLTAIARAQNMWVHVDGAVGGAALFSSRERDRLRGIAAVDSMTWNLHKLSGVTQQCSALIVREPARLRACFSTRADYLFQPDKRNAELDMGDLGIQCARRNDALKAWLTWKARGGGWLASRVERAVDRAREVEDWIRAREAFALAAPRVFNSVCFWWLPPSLRGRPPGQWTVAERDRLHAIAPWVKARLQAEGELLLGYQPVAGGPNAWRLLVINPAVEREDLRFALDAIERHSQLWAAAVEEGVDVDARR